MEIRSNFGVAYLAHAYKKADGNLYTSAYLLFVYKFCGKFHTAFCIFHFV